MKEYFIATIKGRSFEFTKVAPSSSDTWYHISELVNPKKDLIRMSRDLEGSWKIKTLRLPIATYNCEHDFREAIEQNERLDKPEGYEPKFSLTQ